MSERPGWSDIVGRQAEEIRKAWESLPEGMRAELSRTIGLLPTDMKNWRSLIGEALSHLRVASGDKEQVTIVGPANSGKSTLYNALIRSRADQAAVSAVPGTTRRAQAADAGLFSIIDTPGADAAGNVGEEERAKALEAARTADLLVLLFDATHGIRSPEQALFRDLQALQKPMVVALNKMDLVGRERAQVLGRAAAALGVDSSQVVPVSAKHGQGLDRLLVAIAASEPGIVAALGAALPEYRADLVRSVVARAASTAAAIALTPLPFADFLPLIVVQGAMVMSIARIYAYRITLARARELVATFGVGLLARSLFYELTKLGGPPGWLVAAAVSGGTTVAMGQAAALWFERGEKLSADALRRISRGATEGLIGRLGGRGRHAPSRILLKREVEKAVTELPEADPSRTKGKETSG